MFASEKKTFFCYPSICNLHVEATRRLGRVQVYAKFSVGYAVGGGGCKTLLLGQFGDELWGVELLHV